MEGFAIFRAGCTGRVARRKAGCGGTGGLVKNFTNSPLPFRLRFSYINLAVIGCHRTGVLVASLPGPHDTFTMVLPLLCLIGGTLVTLAGVATFASSEATSPACLAVAITLPPAVVTYLVIVRVVRLWPLAGPAVVILGTGFRMLVTVAFLVLLRGRATEFGATPTALAQWTTGFYLLTLALETGLLSGVLTRSTEAATNGPPTG